MPHLLILPALKGRIVDLFCQRLLLFHRFPVLTVAGALYPALHMT